MADPTFEQELAALINRYSEEHGSDTPDFILARYLVLCLTTFASTVEARERWYGRPAPDAESAVTARSQT